MKWLIALALLIIAIVIGVKLTWRWFRRCNKRRVFRYFSFSKTELARYYGVSRETFAKWVNRWVPTVDKTTWKSKKNISGDLLFEIFYYLGLPIKGSSMSKEKLCTTFDISGPTLTHRLYVHEEDFGLEEGESKKWRVFPPSVSERVIKRLSGYF